jgi:hypothetical protein
VTSEIEELRYKSATWRLRARYALFVVPALLLIAASKPPTPVRVALLVVATLAFIVATIWTLKGLLLTRREYRLRKTSRH